MRQFMKIKTLILIFLLLITGLMVINANEVPKNEPVSTLQIKFNFNDNTDNELDKIKSDAVKLKNFGTSFFITGAAGFWTSGVTCLTLVLIHVFVPVFSELFILIPALFIPVFGFMTILGILVMANSWMYIKKGKIYDKIDKVKKTGIILSSILGPLTLLNIAGGLLYYFFYYNIAANQTLLSLTSTFLALSCALIPLPFFMCALPMMITGFIFSNLKKIVSTISYLDADKFAFTNGFSIKF